MTNSSDLPKPAIILVRSSVPGESPTQIDCQVHAVTGKRLTLVARERVRTSTAVSVEYNDSMLLGEIVACTLACDQQWHLELKLEQVLTGLQSLILLRERLLGEPAAPSRTASMAAAVAYER